MSAIFQVVGFTAVACVGALLLVGGLVLLSVSRMLSRRWDGDDIVGALFTLAGCAVFWGLWSTVHITVALR